MQYNNNYTCVDVGARKGEAVGKSVLVIGAGIAGLSAGSYLQRNGFNTRIFELHALPGGVCTAWERQGYRFDGCIHWLMGSSPRSNMHHIWSELGAGELEYIEWDIFTVIKLSDGDRFTVYTDPDRFEEELVRLGGPEDTALARRLAAGVRNMSRFDLPAAWDKLGIAEAIRLLIALPAALPTFGKWMNLPVTSLLASVRSPKLREGLAGLYGGDMGDFPVAGLFMMLGFMAKKSCGYPKGGSLAFARSIERRYLELGGDISYGFRVDRVLVEDGKAVGIAGEKGEVRGDIVISAADAHDTVKRMLGGRYRNPGLDKAFTSFRRFPSLLFLGLGLNGDFSRYPHSYSFPLKEPLVLEDGELLVSTLGIRFFSFDPGAAPAGRTAAMIMIPTRNDAWWTELRNRDHPAYTVAKEEVTRRIIHALDGELPGLAPAVELTDLSTPATLIRYTNNWHGSYEGWLPTIKTMGAKFSGTLDGLSNFHMVGQWLNPGGGLPPCGMDGRRLAKRLCKAEGRAFRTMP